MLPCLPLLTLAALVPALPVCTAQPARPSSTNEATLISAEWVVSQVLTNNSALKAARARWEAALARVPQARAWEDPKAGVDIERAGTTRSNDFTDAEWSAAQAVPLSGRNRARAQSASADAAAVRFNLRRVELNLAARARIAFFRYANAFAQIEVSRRNEGILERFAAISRAKYETGLSPQADLLTAQTELAKLGEARFDLERLLSEVQTELNALMNRDVHAELGRPAALIFKPIELSRFRPQGSSHGSEDDLAWDWPLFEFRMRTLAKAQRPEIRGAQHNLAGAQARHDLARRSWFPDPEIRIEVRQFDGRPASPLGFDTGIFFTMPWLNRPKYKAAIHEARQNVEAAQHDLEAREAETLGLIRNQLKRIEVVEHHYVTFRDNIVPLARQTVQALQSAYTTDKAGFQELLVSQRTANEVESELQQHLAEYLSAIAELEALVGAGPELSRAGNAKP